MTSQAIPGLDSFTRWPKVELHRHLEGSLRFETMLEVAQEHLKYPFTDREQLRTLVQVRPSDPLTFENFLSKFNTIRLFYRSPEIIQRVTREAIEDAAKDNVRYMELRFTPVALARIRGFTLGEVMDWVIQSTQETSRRVGIETRLIASVNRHESTHLAEEVAKLAVDRMSQGIVALDLAGNEAMFPSEPFVGIFKSAREAGLHLTIHAGEWAGPENVAEAIAILETDRVGHGVRVMEDDYAVALARERGTVFEVCLSSNYQSGVVCPLENHPLKRMIQAGLVTTLNTDDPGISDIVLSNEFSIASQTLGLSKETLQTQVLNALKASFLPDRDIRRLTTSLKRELLK